MTTAGAYNYDAVKTAINPAFPAKPMPMTHPPRHSFPAMTTHAAFSVCVWLSKDPIGERGGNNLYLYVNNNRNNIVDLHGLFSWEPLVSKHLDIDTPLIFFNGPGIYGLTWIVPWDWSSNSRIISGEVLGTKKWWADADGKAQVTWWAVDFVREHELQHVAIFARWWTNLGRKVSSLVARPGCFPKTFCCQAAIMSFTSAYLIGAIAENHQLDCDEGNWVACFNAFLQRTAYAQKLDAAERWKSKCESLP